MGGKRGGFTLVEVIVVLVILAILAAIAIPALTGYIDKANTSQIKAKARTAAVAMQTILSEAYADPQTRLPASGNNDGKLYLDGKFLTSIESPASGTYRLFNNEESIYDLFRKLDASSIIPLGNDAKQLAIYNVLFDEHFSLLAYCYLDPETFMTEDMRMCSYNYLIEGTNISYDPSAGFKIWRYDNGRAVPIG